MHFCKEKKDQTRAAESTSAFKPVNRYRDIRRLAAYHHTELARRSPVHTKRFLFVAGAPWRRWMTRESLRRCENGGLHVTIVCVHWSASLCWLYTILPPRVLRDTSLCRRTVQHCTWRRQRRVSRRSILLDICCLRRRLLPTRGAAIAR